MRCLSLLYDTVNYFLYVMCFLSSWHLFCSTVDIRHTLVPVSKQINTFGLITFSENSIRRQEDVCIGFPRILFVLITMRCKEYLFFYIWNVEWKEGEMYVIQAVHNVHNLLYTTTTFIVSICKCTNEINWQDIDSRKFKLHEVSC